MTIHTNHNIWTGEIRDKKDPDQGPKMAVMIHGHDNMDTPIPDANVRWAHCLMNNHASLNGIGAAPKYLPGTTVVGMWLDPETKQVPLILGSIPKSGVSTS